MTDTIDLTMIRGDEPDLTLTPAVPINLTGADLRWTAKYHHWDADDAAAITKTLIAGVENGLELTDAANGVVVVTFERADTASFVGTPVLVWDLQGTLSTGKTRTLARGTLTVTPDITRTAP